MKTISVQEYNKTLQLADDYINECVFKSERVKKSFRQKLVKDLIGFDFRVDSDLQLVPQL